MTNYPNMLKYSKNWKLKLADIEIDNYIVQVGYQYNMFSCNDALYIILFRNDSQVLASTWFETLEKHYPGTWAGLPNREILIHEIIKQVKRIEKLKAFI